MHTQALKGYVPRPTPCVHTQRQCVRTTTRSPYQSVSLDGDAFRPSYSHLWLAIETCVKSVWKEQCVVKQHRFLTCHTTWYVTQNSLTNRTIHRLIGLVVSKTESQEW
jgi:hypothetical protein